MGYKRAHIGKSSHHLTFKWFALRLELIEGELVKAVFGKVITREDIQELVCNPRLAVQALDVEVFEMSHPKCSLDLVFNIANYPWH